MSKIEIENKIEEKEEALPPQAEPEKEQEKNVPVKNNYEAQINKIQMFIDKINKNLLELSLKIEERERREKREDEEIEI